MKYIVDNTRMPEVTACFVLPCFFNVSHLFPNRVHCFTVEGNTPARGFIKTVDIAGPSRS